MTIARTIEESYGSSVDATDLTMRFDRYRPIDTIIVAGMVGVHNPLAMLIWRWVFGGDHNTRHDVLRSLVTWTVHLAAKRNWSNTEPLVAVVVVVADWYNSHTCPACHGTKFETIPGTPSLSDAPCPVCHGSGETSLDKLLIQFGPDWIKRGKEIRNHIDQCVAQAAHEMLRRTRNTMDIAGL